MLAKGSKRHQYRVRELPIADRAPMLKEFLERYAASVQRFYPVPKGSPLEAFDECARTMPVFELTDAGAAPATRPADAGSRRR